MWMLLGGIFAVGIIMVGSGIALEASREAVVPSVLRGVQVFLSRFGTLSAMSCIFLSVIRWQLQ